MDYIYTRKETQKAYVTPSIESKYIIKI